MARSLVKGMKLNDKQIKRLVTLCFQELKAANIITFKEKEEKVFARACEIVKQDYIREQELDAEVEKMMDDLERKNPGEFQRYVMFPLLKKRLAKEKKVIL